MIIDAIAISAIIALIFEIRQLRIRIDNLEQNEDRSNTP